MSFSHYRNKVQEVMEKLRERTILQAIEENRPKKVKNNRERQKQKEILDLNIIQNKIDLNEYHSIAEWKNDVNKVWDNIIHNNKNIYLQILIAKEMKKYFAQLTQFISDSLTNDWNNELNSLSRTFLELYKKNPQFNHSHKRRLLGKRDLLIPELKVTPPSTRRNYQPFSNEDLQRLSIQINQIKEDSMIQEIIDILKDGPPAFFDKDGLITLNLNLLSPAILKRLQEKVDEFYS